jgi:2-(1,2-epoxy-1,2-dihydrophenyl)acetyl-CoA isomerase
MIYKVVPDEQLVDEAMKLASRLAAGPTVSYGQIRQAVLTSASASYDTALRIEEEAQRTAGNAGDCREAVTAFLEKRAPEFRGE